MPRAKKVKVDPIVTKTAELINDADRLVSLANLTPPVQQPKRTMRLLSWDKRINAGMLYISHDAKVAVYHVRRIPYVSPLFTFQKVQPTADGLSVNTPYSVSLYKNGGGEDGYRGVCGCAGHKARKECRHVDAAITMIEEYGV